MDRLQSAFGVLVMMLLAFLLCPKDRRRHIQWRPILGGLALLLLTAVLVLKTGVRVLFQIAGDGVDHLLTFCGRGSAFIFGSLSDGGGAAGPIFAFQILPTIVFFSALMSLLYYARILPVIVRIMGRTLSGLLGTSGAESFSTAADVFVGQTEAPLVIKPYVALLTKSELVACMTAGFATTAGGVLAAYIGFLKDSVPNIAAHLIACSVMCAPASLVIAKLVMPETEQPQTSGKVQIEIPKSADNALEALAAGTTDGVKLAVNVAAMMLVFLAVTYLADALLGWVGGLVDLQLSLRGILGKIFAPLAWTLGVPSEDISKVGSLLGQKTVLNEFLAYQDMGTNLKADPGWLTERGRLIASYALCGFANFGSIGIQIGGYSTLAPERRTDISRVALRAMVAGMLATCMVAALAGVLV